LNEIEKWGSKLGPRGWVNVLAGDELHKAAKILTVTGLLLLTAGTRLSRWLKKG
jgi:hypothetical protein